VAAQLDCALGMQLEERIRRHRELLVALERDGDSKAWARSFLDRLANLRPHRID
jgi:trehalose-6-phosphate synthase